MHDRRLYQHILGLAAPWTVTGVQLNRKCPEIRVPSVVPEARFLAMHHLWATRWKIETIMSHIGMTMADIPKISKLVVFEYDGSQKNKERVVFVTTRR
jgi:hypothetical protein